MLDHVGFPVSDYERSRAFYKRALEPLGIELIVELPPQKAGGNAHAGFGRKGRAQFWIGTGKALQGQLHIAFEAASRGEVDAFHAAALRDGASDNGTPGLRPQYHPDYYGAFVLDPDGHNIEAVCRAP
ncbi:MAG: VOC family protein [Hyphomicrobiales bacterium]|nr:VOC family protein [Hyphomicrobiales bacterium]MBV9739198.1 VOC family protein [Hyphomicrobiales bacterium]